MKYRKFNKYEKKEINKAFVANALAGEGLYLYENKYNAELTLPRPTKSGVKKIGPKQQFQGDNYYMQMVRRGELKFIKELQSPEQERITNNEDDLMLEEKMILEQPPTITEQGKVEHVQSTPVQPLGESSNQPKPDVLLNENPVDDGFVIVN